MAAKGLIIGGHGGIGSATLATLTMRKAWVHWFVPTYEELDVNFPQDILKYVDDNGPFKYIVYSPGVNVLRWIKDLGWPGSIFDQTWSVNCAGFVHLLGCHERRFPEAEGSIVAVSSDAARRPMRGSISYCSSKAALDMAVKCAARELAPRWRVNAVSPGMTDNTGMTRSLDEQIPKFRGWSPEYARQYEDSQNPMGRRARPAEIAEVVAGTLFGPQYLSGSIIEVNGAR